MVTPTDLQMGLFSGYTSSGMLLEIPATEAQSLLTTGQVLGFAQLRLLPKRTSVRPIVNLGKRATIGPSKVKDITEIKSQQSIPLE